MNKFKELFMLSIIQYDLINDSHHMVVLNLVWFIWSDLSLILSQFSLCTNINSPLYRNTYYSLKIKRLDLYYVTYITHFPFYHENSSVSLWTTNLVSSKQASHCITERHRQNTSKGFLMGIDFNKNHNMQWPVSVFPVDNMVFYVFH